MLPGKKYRPEDFLKILHRRFWYLVLPFVIISAGVSVYARRLPSYYRAEASIMVVPQTVSSDVIRAPQVAPPAERIQTIANSILTRTRLERIVTENNLYANERRAGAIMEDLVEGMKARVTVQPFGRDSFKIVFTGDNPQEVALVANKLMALFIDESVKSRTNLADATSQFLDVTLDESRRRLEANEQQLREYKRAHGNELPDQLASNTSAANGVAMQLQTLRESMNIDAQRRAGLERSIADLESMPIDIATPVTALPESARGASGAPQTFKQQLAQAEQQLAQLQALKYTDNHPRVKQLKTIIEDLRGKADAEELSAPISSGGTSPIAQAELAKKKKIAGWRAEIEQIDAVTEKKKAEETRLQGVLAEYLRRIDAAPTRDSEMTGMTRDYNIIRQMYTMYSTKQEESKIAASLERRQAGEQFQILDSARPPSKPVNNRLQVTTMGMAVGLALGLALVVLLEYLDRSFRNDEEVTGVLSLPVLAVVPLMMSAPDRKKKMRRRVLLGMGLGSTVMVCLTVFAWAFFK